MRASGESRVGFFVIMCVIDSGAAGRRDARACGGWWRGREEPVQPD